MAGAERTFLILMADDDTEDCLLVRDAVAEQGLPCALTCVPHGEALLEYLRRQEGYREAAAPDLILLDLSMPLKDGREALREMKADPRLCAIPVVVLTTSSAEDDVGFCYRHGAASFVPKPSTYRDWLDLVAGLWRYWFQLVRLPNAR